MLFLSSYQHSGDLHRARVKTKTSGQCWCSRFPWGGSKEKKKKGPMSCLSPPQEFNPRIFFAYTNISSSFTSSFQKLSVHHRQIWNQSLPPPSGKVNLIYNLREKDQTNWVVWGHIILLFIWTRKNHLSLSSSGVLLHSSIPDSL